MSLTDTAVRQAKPVEKAQKLYDERGLFLFVSPAGGKWWRFKYRFGGKEKLLSLGVYPDVSLKEARGRREEVRRMLAQGIDPGTVRKGEKAEAAQEEETFERVAREWFAKHAPNWCESHRDRIIGRLERDIFPWLGQRPVKDITSMELLTVIRRVESRTLETAHRELQNCGQVLRYAVATGRTAHNVAADLRGALPPSRKRHFASVTEPQAVGELLRAIDGYSGHFTTQCALRIAPLLFVRPGELRHAEWQEIDLDAGEWRIPAHKMKMKEQHIVPLSRQAVVILRELKPLTGDAKYVFPSIRSANRPMSNNTILAALRRMGYSKDEMTGHGFRSMASTILHEQGWPSDVVERQLAHAERNSIKASYNFAQHLPERRKMMQAWADYLDALKAGAKVIPIHEGQEK